MPAILNSLNAHNFLIFQPILMILVSIFMVYRVFPNKTYLLLGLPSALNINCTKTSKLYQILNTSPTARHGPWGLMSLNEGKPYMVPTYCMVKV